MTAQELAVLRDRVARARIRRERVHADEDAAVSLLPRRARCVYCGQHLKARYLIACVKHRDLLGIDPRYAAVSFLGRKAA